MTEISNLLLLSDEVGVGNWMSSKVIQYAAGVMVPKFSILTLMKLLSLSALATRHCAGCRELICGKLEDN